LGTASPTGACPDARSPTSATWRPSLRDARPATPPSSRWSWAVPPNHLTWVGVVTASTPPNSGHRSFVTAEACGPDATGPRVGAKPPPRRMAPRRRPHRPGQPGPALPPPPRRARRRPGARTGIRRRLDGAARPATPRAPVA